jgi:hypothetical protein
MKTKRATPKIAPSRLKTPKPKCGLCGKRTNLALTACCGNWICNDQHKYVLFSYARNSCQRNHDRYTLCSSHYHEKHKGDWQTCAKCKKSIETEMYVWYGTNEYNFEKLENPPSYKPTKCAQCGKIIALGTDGYLIDAKKYFCWDCGEERRSRMV